jgi:S-adenosylmethionine:tRNA ribosyltransferase-isomerase
MIQFTLPPDGEAVAPAEHRGLRRDDVRLLAARPGGIEHHHFRDLPELLDPGDLVVVNTSATLPAAIDSQPRPLHVSTTLDDGTWVVEARRPDGPELGGRRGDEFALPGGYSLRLLAPYPDDRVQPSRLWRAAVTPEVRAHDYLSAHGRPIGYRYLSARYPLVDHQTVYATQPGSAEMPSAGRPFTDRLLVRLMARGISVAPIVLHAGVSSPEPHEPPLPERFEVPVATARLITVARGAGQRVVAVGTTVVRALETTEGRAGSGWTDLVLGPERPARVISGLVSGLHAPEASHLSVLEAVAGTDLVDAAYRAAVAEHYLWHEFGDSMLFLPQSVAGAT